MQVHQYRDRTFCIPAQITRNTNGYQRMLRFDNTPTYKQTPPNSNEQITVQTLRQLQKLRLSKQEIGARQVLYINRVTDSQLIQFLSPVRGVGSLTINRIVTERFLHGHFLSEEDFDRRLSRLSFSRLAQLCKPNGITISFAPSDDSQQIGPGDVNYLSVMTNSSAEYEEKPSKLQSRQTASVSAKKSLGQSCTRETQTLLISTWNAAHLSLRGRAFEQKLHHLCMFIKDSGVHLLCMQEVSSRALSKVMDHILVESGHPWSLLRDNMNGDKSLAMIYREDCVRITPLAVPQQEVTFSRSPQIAIATPFHTTDSSIAIMHVHVSQVQPGKEIVGLAGMVHDMVKRAKIKCSSSEVFPLVLGDFNMNPDALSFIPMKKAGLVEMVGPQSAASQSHAFRTLCDPTTVGGHWLDNVWIGLSARSRVRDAWGFRFAGRTRALSQSPYTYAADRRARSSDHTPVTVELDMSAAVPTNNKRSADVS